MIIEMIACQIRKNGDCKFQPITAAQINRLRRSFHYRHSAIFADGFAQKSVGVGCFGRCANCRFALFADAIFNRRQHRGFLVIGFGKRETQISRRRFAVRSRNSDEL